MNRTAAGVVVGFLVMLVAPFFFTEWVINSLFFEGPTMVSLGSIFTEMGTNPASAFAMWFSLGFQGNGSIFIIFGGVNWIFDPIGNVREIAWMTIMAWFTTAFVIGLIIKGWKRSIIGALGVFLTYFALFLIMAVLAQLDLTSMFTGAYLIDHIGVLLTGGIFSVLGAGFGGAIAGAGEG